MPNATNSSLKSILWWVLRKDQFDRIRPKLCNTLAFKIQGKTRRSYSDLAILAFAKEEIAAYFSKISYSDTPEPNYLAKISFNEIPSLIDKVKPNITIVGASPVFSKFLFSKGFFVMPYVNFSLEISGSWDSILHKMHRTKRKKIRRIEKLGCTYEVTKDKEKLKLFYQKMYKPRILSRHGKTAEVVGFAECERLFRKGGLLLVKLNGKYVAGAIYVGDHPKLYIPTLGVDYESQYLTENMAILPLYFLISWGKENGYTKIDYGTCQPFLKSGIFQYKKELGMTAEFMNTTQSRIMAIKFCTFDIGTRDFLSSNPIIFVSKEKMRGLVVFDPAESLYDFYVPGLSALDILCPTRYVSELKKRYKLIEKINLSQSPPIAPLLKIAPEMDFEAYTLSF